jgi:hypothetical protein
MKPPVNAAYYDPKTRRLVESSNLAKLTPQTIDDQLITRLAVCNTEDFHTFPENHPSTVWVCYGPEMRLRVFFLDGVAPRGKRLERYLKDIQRLTHCH